MRVPDDPQFEASSPVGRYWLVNGAGFTVCRADGRRLGLVEEVLVDSTGRTVEYVALRRRGLAAWRGRLELDPGAVGVVIPSARLFLVRPASLAPLRSPIGRGRVLLALVRAGLQTLARAAVVVTAGAGRLAAAARPLGLELSRRSLAAAGAGGRLSRRGAAAGAAAAARTAALTRREAPRLAAWLSLHGRSGARRTHAGLHVLAGAGRATATRLAVAASAAARALGDAAVVAAVFVVAAWRRVAASARPGASSSGVDVGGPKRPEPEAADWRGDADAALARETRASTTTAASRREARAAAEARRAAHAGTDE